MKLSPIRRSTNLPSTGISGALNLTEEKKRILRMIWSRIEKQSTYDYDSKEYGYTALLDVDSLWTILFLMNFCRITMREPIPHIFIKIYGESYCRARMDLIMPVSNYMKQLLMEQVFPAGWIFVFYVDEG